ncbi:MAG: hypothetical protein KatS3mg105_3066 [Gemmatales bacterium]|nr:MAG: hypothetical protein KatS3mg105_3066 [Gemmatales bacterium]
MVACLVALGVLYLCLQPVMPTIATDVVILIGLTGIVVRWSIMPILFLFALAWLLSSEPARWMLSLQGHGLRSKDAAICVAGMAYLVFNLRLQAFSNHVFPVEKIWTWDQSETVAVAYDCKVRRYGKQFDMVELVQLLLVLLIATLAAQAIWLLLDHYAPYWRTLPRFLWQGLILIWGIFVVVYLAHGMLEYIGRCKMTAAEAETFLQDVLWHQTRGEQRRASRSLARFRLGKRSILTMATLLAFLVGFLILWAFLAR